MPGAARRTAGARAGRPADAGAARRSGPRPRRACPAAPPPPGTAPRDHASWPARRCGAPPGAPRCGRGPPAPGRHADRRPASGWSGRRAAPGAWRRLRARAACGPPGRWPARSRRWRTGAAGRRARRAGWRASTRLRRSFVSSRVRSSRDSSRSDSSSAIRSSARHSSPARARVSSATRRPASRSQLRIRYAPVTAAAAAAAARPRRTRGSASSQVLPAQRTETPTTADDGRILCRGGEWRWRPRGMA